ncbi:MAG TPA: ArsA family ATPase [Gemmatimonadota bacterium]|nr:ArsA family ATPase [Gemmatimonadota bacterium]
MPAATTPDRPEPPAGAPAEGLPSVRVFIGKGGVGKSTCSAATAVGLAGRGVRTLAISTDPTPSLSHVFELAPGGDRPREVRPGLEILELGREQVRAMWDERFGRDVYRVFSAFVDVDYPTFVEFITSVLPGLNEEFMVDHIRRLAGEEEYEAIVWDTAPLGQTLALLETPALLGDHLRMAPRIYSRLRSSGASRESILDVLARWEELARACMAFLRESVSFTMVTIPEALAVEQLEGVLSDMASYDLKVDRLVVNNVVREEDSDFLRRKAEGQRAQLERIRERWGHLPIVTVPLFPYELRGVARLEEVARILRD